MEIISASLPSRFDVISDFIAKALEALKQRIILTEQEIFDIKLVLEESITNAVKHGNKFNEKLEVRIEIFLEENLLTIEVRDQGPGFDVKKIPDPTKKEGLMRTSGRGVFLIKKLMDRVEYLGNGREIKMVKKLSKIAK